MTDVSCPSCGYDLFEDESYDISIEASECREYVTDHCENCGKKYQWQNVFVFSDVKEIEEVS